MVAQLGAYTFTREAIVDFARTYDPQRFHMDDEAAKRSVFGALCASGWHTASVWMRLNILHGRDEWRRLTGVCELPTFGPSPGIRDLRWLRPVFVDETVHYRTEVLAKRPSASRPGWGILENRSFGALADGTPVIQMDGAVLVPTA